MGLMATVLHIGLKASCVQHSHLENQTCMALECCLDSGCPWLYSIWSRGFKLHCCQFCGADREKGSPSSRAEAWSIKTAPVHVPGRRSVTGSQESGPAIVCIYIDGCQEVWAA